jgi:hypothetical protein
MQALLTELTVLRPSREAGGCVTVPCRLGSNLLALLTKCVAGNHWRERI